MGIAGGVRQMPGTSVGFLILLVLLISVVILRSPQYLLHEYRNNGCTSRKVPAFQGGSRTVEFPMACQAQPPGGGPAGPRTRREATKKCAKRVENYCFAAFLLVLVLLILISFPQIWIKRPRGAR
ncbi:MAG: hypothetical protein AB9869_13705 [Verrucomicrobiia bacterium]